MIGVCFVAFEFGFDPFTCLPQGSRLNLSRLEPGVLSEVAFHR
jgi:hypothetical protein